MSQTCDIIIVGAGIVGAACAMKCARAGLRTLVLDRGCLSGGTTAAGMGHIVIMDDSEAQFSLTNYSRRLWMDWRPRLAPDVEYDACGTIWVAADAEEMTEVHRKEEFYQKRGARVEVLNAAAVAKAEPNLRAGLAGGLLVPDDAVVYPPCAARFFVEQAVAAGAELRTGVRVAKLLTEGGVELADGTRISAGRSVSATGPWSPELTPGLPVRKRKGHLVITERAPGFVRHQLVELGYLKSAHSLGKDSVAFNVQPASPARCSSVPRANSTPIAPLWNSQYLTACCGARWNLCRSLENSPPFGPGQAIARPRQTSCQSSGRRW